MSQRVVIKSFADLALVLQLETNSADQAEVAQGEPITPDANDIQQSDLSHLLSELEAASATLRNLEREDQAARASAFQSLEQYDILVTSQKKAEEAFQRAQQVRIEAEALAETGFTDEARSAAQRLTYTAQQAEAVATRIAVQRKAKAESLAAHLDVERLLAERQRQEEAERVRTAQKAQNQRLAEALVAAQAALDRGRLEEAKQELERVAHEAGDCADFAALRHQIAQREFAANTTRAEDAVWAARREYRRDPAAAVARLEALDVEGLPEPLSRQVFGIWATACVRLCRERDIEQPLRYAPYLGRGAVIAHEKSTDAYVVVSSLGMGSGWSVGHTVSERLVRQARPLC